MLGQLGKDRERQGMDGEEEEYAGGLLGVGSRPAILPVQREERQNETTNTAEISLEICLQRHTDSQRDTADSVSGADSNKQRQSRVG